MSCLPLFSGISEIATKVFRFLWGDLSREEYKKYGFLACVFFFLIGSYWMVRAMKNAIFMKIVGSTGIPYAKMISVTFLIVLVMFYSKLVDMLEKNKLLYVLATGYGCIFLLMTYFLNHPTIGLPNTVASKWRIFGWVVYLVIESFGSLMPALFWAFVNSTSERESAKRGYGIVMGGAQFGSVLGCILDMQATTIGMQTLFVIATAGIFIIPFMVAWYVRHHPSAPEIGQPGGKTQTGIFEGLRLLASKPYLFGILAISTLYELISAIIDYQMKTLMNEAYSTAAGVTEIDALYGLFANALAMTFAFIGTSFFLRRFGLRVSLVVYPIAVGAAICFMWAFHGLWVLMATMVLIKGLSYALNNPCRDIMYLPTSKDIKFKVKGWIETIGMRGAKGVGGGVTALFPVMANLVFYGSLISLGVVGVWIAAAVYVGRKNHQLVEENKIIE